ncbi:FAD/NAD(P)-binding protein [Rhizobiaceae bacterium BDR2-2]|uniref:FAD/NAD(P)-binding protein n=1 Tax=Ectorhizobium quercum TaxID=2965071 RepID=A0AAE3N2J6_9HYPH|nr:FAD/NAD(P)-binding protein [Ectorhizobium quercum]MCX8999643.1 FAD/NAD(P)-binding protein [Ectorhizobium quercum]
MLPKAETGYVEPAAGRHRVVIVGGGFSGASVARCLALGGHVRPGDLVVYEPRHRLGAGLAYDTANPALRLNAAAHKMRVLPEQPDAFLRFMEQRGHLARDPEAMSETGDIYASRADFADFMGEAMQPFLDDGTILHCRERIADVARVAGGWHIRTDTGTNHFADTLVIAIGHPPATAPAPLSPLIGQDERILTDPNRTGSVAIHDRVLIVGAGLTALDYLAALDQQGHKGPITLLCRSGLLPERHSDTPTEPFGDFLSPPSRSATALLAAVRETLEKARAAGKPWQCVFDTLRKQGQAIWRDLPDAERARFLRHLGRRYEVSRFRMPPQNETLLRKLRQEGRLEMLTGRVESARSRRSGLEIGLRLRHGGRILHQTFDRVAIATGSDQSRHFHTQPWLESLRMAGHIVPAALGLGIACDQDSRAIASDGRACRDLFVIGPPTRATFGEITGAPEIVVQAAHIARQIDATLAPSHAVLQS